MNKKILWIDDDLASLEYYAQEFSDNDVDVSWATNIHDALLQLKNTNFDFVVTDLRMQDANGIQALESVYEVAPNVGTAIFSAFLHDKELQTGLDNLPKRPLIFSKSSTSDFEKMLTEILYDPEIENGDAPVGLGEPNQAGFVLQIDGNRLAARLDTGADDTWISLDWLRKNKPDLFENASPNTTTMTP